MGGKRIAQWHKGRKRYRAPAPVYPDFGGRKRAKYVICTLREALVLGAWLKANATKPAAAAKAIRHETGNLELGLAKLKYVGRNGSRRGG